MSSSPATEVRFSPFALSSTGVVMVLLGAVGALFGPLLETFHHVFHVTTPVASEALSVFFAGSFVGIVPGWRGIKKLPGRYVFSASLVVLGLGLIAATFAHQWHWFLATLFLVGLGFGGMDMSLNSLLSRTAVEGRAHRISIVNAGYGVGAVICPVLIIVVHPRHFAILLWGFAIVSLALSTAFGGLHAPAQETEELQQKLLAQPAQRRPILWTFIAAYVAYVALETSSTGWMSTQLQGHGRSTTLGAIVTAGFWIGLAGGRSIGGWIHRYVADTTVVLTCLAASVVLCLLSEVTAVAVVTYPLLGLVLANVFSTGLVWFARLCPHDADGLAWVILFMMLGGVAGSALVGVAVDHLGVNAIPIALALMALATFAIFLRARVFSPIVVD